VQASAQSIYGGIHGTVRDATGEPAQDATVTIASVEKGTQLKVNTDRSGHYEFLQLLPETYDLEAEASGRKQIITDISVFANEEALADARLPKQGKVGAAVGGSPLKIRSDVATTLDRSAIQDLPNFDRNFTRFALLAPSAQIRTLAGNSSQDPQATLLVSLNGQYPAGTPIELDGTDNRAAGVVINSPLESLAEVKITTQSFDAQSGQALSGNITAQTRSGSNSWHGSMFDFRHSSWGEASNPNLDNPSLAVISPFKVNIAGGSVGGPIAKNKIFIFGDYQGTRRSFSSYEVLNVPTQKVRDTCFNPAASSPCDLSDYLPNGSQIYDPRSGKPFQANGCPEGVCIPHDRISQQAVGLLSLLPAPNLSGPVSNYQVSGTEGYNDDVFDIRLDDNWSRKATLFGRYSFADYRIDAPSAFGPLVGGPGLSPGGFAGQTRSRDQSISTGFDYALLPGLFTDVRFGFYRQRVRVFENSYGSTPATDAGIRGLNLPGDNLSSGMPAIVVIQPPSLAITSSNITFGDGAVVNACVCPLLEKVQQFQWVNNWVRGYRSHWFKWGGDFRYLQNFILGASSSHRAGVFSFAPKDTANPMRQQGLGLATFLLGDVSSFNRTVGNISDAEVYQKRLFLYGQDTWRIAPRLTLSYGLRWEVYFPQSVNGRNRGGWLDLSTGMINVAGYPCCSVSGNVQNTLKNFAPRTGIAYQVSTSTIVRAAYGRNFDSSAEVYSPSATLNPPVQLDQAAQTVDGTNYVFQLGKQGTDPIPPPPTFIFNVPSSGQFVLPPGVTVVALPSSLRVPTLDQWNLTVQHALTPNLYLEVGYVGNKGTHLPPQNSTYNLNQRTIAGYVANKCDLDDTKASCLARFPFYNTIAADGTQLKWQQMINYAANVSSSNYSALQAKLVKRLTKGYEFEANYTWGKGLAYQANYYVHDPRLGYGVNDFDRKHRFIFYNVLSLPVGRGKALLGSLNSTANYFVGGWSVNTITTWASGLAFSPTYLATECSEDRDTGPCRPNLVGAVQITGNRNHYFTTATSSLGPSVNRTGPGTTSGPWQRPALGTFGDVRYNSLRGPGYYDTDLAVLKNIPISESYTIQFRTDFLNVFNRVNLGNPSGCVDCFVNGAPTGAVITSLAPNASQRQLEFALRLQF
jgi:hypothetical protein